jgi:hypothetical protein
MEITTQCVVALTWTLKDSQGEVLDVLAEPVEFLVGGDDLLTKIEEALQGHGPGDAVDMFTWSPRTLSGRMTKHSFSSRREAVCHQSWKKA